MGGKTGGRNHFSRPDVENLLLRASHLHIQLKRQEIWIIVCAGSYVVRHLEFMELVKHV